MRSNREILAKSVSTTFTLSAHKCAKSAILRSAKQTEFCEENLVHSSNFFVSKLHEFTQMTSSCHEINATVPYPAHLVLVTFSKKYFRFLSDYGYTLAATLSWPTSEKSAKAERTFAALYQ